MAVYLWNQSPVATVVCAGAALVAAAAICAALAPRGAAGGERGLRAFLGFKRLWVRPVVTFCYVFGACAGVSVWIGYLAVLLPSLVGAPLDQWVTALAVATFFAAVFEVGLRVGCELVMLFVGLCEEGRGRTQGAETSPAPAAVVPAPAAGAEACANGGVPVAGTEAPANGAGQPCRNDGMPVGGAQVRPNGAVPASFAERTRVMPAVGEVPVAPAVQVAPPPAPMAPAVPVPREPEPVAPPEAPGPVDETAFGPTVFDAQSYAAYVEQGFAEASWSEAEQPFAEAACDRSAQPAVADEPPAEVDVPRPAPRGFGFPPWNCACGSVGNTGAYCGHCGRPRGV